MLRIITLNVKSNLARPCLTFSFETFHLFSTKHRRKQSSKAAAKKSCQDHEYNITPHATYFTTRIQGHQTLMMHSKEHQPKEVFSLFFSSSFSYNHPFRLYIHRSILLCFTHTFHFHFRALIELVADLGSLLRG